MRIVPRNATGGRAFSLCMASLIALFIGALSTAPGLDRRIVVIFLTHTGLWTIAVVRPMLARSELVKLDELLEISKRDRKNRCQKLAPV